MGNKVIMDHFLWEDEEEEKREKQKEKREKQKQKENEENIEVKYKKIDFSEKVRKLQIIVFNLA